MICQERRANTGPAMCQRHWSGKSVVEKLTLMSFSECKWKQSSEGRMRYNNNEILSSFA